ncbi:MAG TPA: rubredoxin [Geobacteraceae bacterium]|nr:rubredoxin [Geobacteraceae bacterium]
MAAEKKWQCVVCGYIHENAAPPKSCPTCGVDATKFVVFK